MKEKKLLKEQVPEVETSNFWDKHIDSVRPAIEKLDRRQMESIAKAPFIVVSQPTK